MPDDTITATEANRHFSRLLRDVENGGRVTITRDGRPIAVLAPYRVEERHPNASALKRLEKLLDEGLPIGFTGGLDRDEIHRR